MDTRRSCSVCKIVKNRNQYGRNNWKKGDRRRCRSCAGSGGNESVNERPTKIQRTGNETLAAVAVAPVATAPFAAPGPTEAPIPSWVEALESLKKKQDEMNKKQDEMNKKQDEINIENEKKSRREEEANRRIEDDIADLKASRSRKGVTTLCEFHRDLWKRRLLRSDAQENVWQGAAAWPLPEAAEVPQDGTRQSGEAGVQALLSAALSELEELGRSEKWTSVPDPMAFQKPSFLARKPDIVNYKKGMKGCLAITSFGDIKKRGSGDFASDEVGHILDMARSFLEHVGMYRPFLIVFLTDAKRWQFFRVARDAAKSGDYDYRQATVIDDPAAGWERYVALLTSNLSELGYFEPSMDGVEIKSPLGIGGSAVVYDGTYKEMDVLVKVFDANMESSYYAEKDALSVMQGVPGVPQVQAFLQLTKTIKGVCGKALVTTPVGTVFAPRQGGSFVNGKHLNELVHIVEAAHERDVLHRDIKPDNIYLSDDDMLLNDWGSAVTSTSADDVVWEGTFGFSVSRQEDPNGALSGKVRDLIGVVRTAYSLLFQEMPPPQEATAIEYWKARIRRGTCWETAVKHAMDLEYEELGKLLGQMK